MSRLDSAQSSFRRRREIENEIGDLEYQLDDLRAELEVLDDADFSQPDKETLLAVYGAPGHWPVEAAA